MKTVIEKHGMRLYRGLLSLCVFLIAYLTGGETQRVAPFIIGLLLLLCVGLICFKHIKYLTLPFLHLTLLLIFCYDSYSFFINYVWLLPIVLIALGVHIWRIRPGFRRGKSFLPLVAVAVATVLGGIGMISPADYFRGASLGFMAGLGPGLVFSYWIMKNEIRNTEDSNEYLTDILYWGLTAALIVFAYTVPNILANGMAYLNSQPQWSNNISTMLMIAMPTALALKNRGIMHYVLTVFMCLATLLVGSRGGQVFVCLELLICFFWAWRTECDAIKRMWNRLFFIYAVMLACYGTYLLLANRELFGLTGTNEVRQQLLVRGFSDFVQNPLFGSGLGYRGNADLFSGKAGTINWYHIFIAQVVGGLGLCGIAAWGWQLITRFKLALKVWRKPVFGAALCYLGLFFMSMVNPGEFCPVPYAFLAVVMFVLIEKEWESTVDYVS